MYKIEFVIQDNNGLAIFYKIINLKEYFYNIYYKKINMKKYFYILTNKTIFTK